MNELSAQQKKQVIKSLVEVVQAFADKDYQQRIWIRGEGPEVDDFDDAICDFCPTADAIIEEHKDFKLSREQLESLKKLNTEVSIFADENNLPELFIDTPDWDKIVNLAKELIKVFKSYQI